MSKKNTTSFHVKIPTELHAELKEFSDSRGQTMTASVKYALEMVLSAEPADYRKFVRIKKAVTKLFMIPQGFLVNSFWIALVIIGRNDPNGNSRKWWGKMVYKSEDDMTNAQVIQHIMQDIQRGGRQEKR